jgi:hypothetical protein
VSLLKRTQLTNAKWQFRPDQKAMSELWYWETKSVIQLQRRHGREYGEQAPGRESIKQSLEQFQGTGSVPCIRRAHEVIGPFFFQRKTANNTIYLDMLALFEDRIWHTFKQTLSFNKMVPLHTGPCSERVFQTDRLGGTEQCPGPPLTRYNPIGFFLLDHALLPKPGSVLKFRARINNAVASVTPLMLENTWREIEYRLDILRASNGAHTEKY